MKKESLDYDGRAITRTALAMNRLSRPFAIVGDSIQTLFDSNQFAEANILGLDMTTHAGMRYALYLHLFEIMTLLASGVANGDYKSYGQVHIEDKDHGYPSQVRTVDYGQAQVLPTIQDIENVIFDSKSLLDQETVKDLLKLFNEFGLSENIKVFLQDLLNISNGYIGPKTRIRITASEIKNILERVKSETDRASIIHFCDEVIPIAESVAKDFMPNPSDGNCLLAIVDLIKSLFVPRQEFEIKKNYGPISPHVKVMLHNLAVGEEQFKVNLGSSMRLLLIDIAKMVGFEDEKFDGVMINDHRVAAGTEELLSGIDILSSVKNQLKKSTEQAYSTGNLNPELFVNDLIGRIYQAWFTSVRENINTWVEAMVDLGGVDRDEANDYFRAIREFVDLDYSDKNQKIDYPDVLRRFYKETRSWLSKMIKSLNDPNLRYVMQIELDKSSGNAQIRPGQNKKEDTYFLQKVRSWQ